MKQVMFLISFIGLFTSAHSSININSKPVKDFNGATFISVGDDNLCDIRLGTSKIQDAINTGAPEIRIASNATYTENLLIDNQSVKLRGGFPTCVEANNNDQSGVWLEIDGSGSATTVIRISGSNQRNTVELDTLNIINGTGTLSYPGGGVSMVGADVFLDINNTYIQENTSLGFGGGIGMVIGNADVRMVDSYLLFNNAKTGGGLSCIGANNSIELIGNSGVTGNSATAAGGVAADGQGGGVYLRDGCQFTMYSGTSDLNAFDFRGVYANTSKAEGGGIYAESGAQVILRGYEHCVEFDCEGDNTNPVSVTDNTADFANTGSFHGGGIYATGLNTVVFIASGLLHENEASGYGGGIAVLDQASLIIKRLTSECWYPERCNWFYRNDSGINNGVGGAIYNDNANVDISATNFEENRADFATAIYSIGASAVTHVEGSIFARNGNNGISNFLDQYVIRSYDGSSTQILHSTFVDNKSTINVFGISAGAGDFSLLSSIVHDATVGNVLNANAGGVINIDCVIAHEITSIGSGTHLLVDDPEFVDRVAYDFHINAFNSPAVDFCNSSTIPQNNDIDYQAFGWDNVNVTDIYGPFDVGADETYGNDLIFENGFE